MRFRQFYSKLYFRVTVDLIGLPDLGKTPGGAVSTAPHFFTSGLGESIDKRLKENFTFTLIECKLSGTVENRPQKAQWLMCIENNRVPEYPDKNDVRFNLTGTAAIRRCVEEAIAETVRRSDPIVEAEHMLGKIIDRDCVAVTAILVP